MPSRWLLNLFCWLVPRADRSEWRARWTAALSSLQVLIERGELPGPAALLLAALCREALAEALSLRAGPLRLRRWIRGPALPLVSAAAAILLLAVFSQGFTATRSLIDMAQTVDTRALLPGRYDPRSDALVSHAVPMIFALLTGVVLIGFGGLPLRRSNWRYWSFLGGKILAVAVVLPLAWIEGGHALRAAIHQNELRALLGGLAFTVAFIAAFGCALAWTFADQRRRCPICLHLLTLPVTFGSWSSVLDAVTTEFVCEDGHGTLTVPETETAPPDRWIGLDPSWHDL
jgi:hypothetical protein